MNVFNRIRKQFMHSHLRRQGGGRGGSKVGGGHYRGSETPCSSGTSRNNSYYTNLF